MLKTEERNPKTTHIDKMDTLSMVRVINEENYNAVRAVENVLDTVADAVDMIAERFQSGGRLFYIGAGTSGRLGIVDAAECPPTFGTDKDRVIGIIAGGEKCITVAGEGVEDQGDEGVRDIAQYCLCDKDVVVGLSVAGNAAYIVKALEYARSQGSKTVGITSNAGSLLDRTADISIVADTGAEVITGSTRMKAGTAQKIILNMISTCVMVKCGYVYENLMINLKPSNKKLRHRVISIVSDLLLVDEEEAERLLAQNDWEIRETVENTKQSKGKV